ncbi:hypothetical protein OH77DRAFT_519230 [Trametes cingulata]|nr:hypothetical protein OH77DRAFT_519230 [Trametes cingulata]
MTFSSLARLATNLCASRHCVHQAAAALARGRRYSEFPGDSAGLIVAPGFSTRLTAGKRTALGHSSESSIALHYDHHRQPRAHSGAAYPCLTARSGPHPVSSSLKPMPRIGRRAHHTFRPRRPPPDAKHVTSPVVPTRALRQHHTMV